MWGLNGLLRNPPTACDRLRRCLKVLGVDHGAGGIKHRAIIIDEEDLGSFIAAVSQATAGAGAPAGSMWAVKQARGFASPSNPRGGAPLAGRCRSVLTGRLNCPTNCARYNAFSAHWSSRPAEPFCRLARSQPRSRRAACPDGRSSRWRARPSSAGMPQSPCRFR